MVAENLKLIAKNNCLNSDHHRQVIKENKGREVIESYPLRAGYYL